jgi:hypothetical protein
MRRGPPKSAAGALNVPLTCSPACPPPFPHRGEQVFEALAAKHAAKAAKAQAKAPEKHIIPGATPVSQAEFKMFQQALKESPAGSWAPRKHAVVNDGGKVGPDDTRVLATCDACVCRLLDVCQRALSVANFEPPALALASVR